MITRFALAVIAILGFSTNGLTEEYVLRFETSGYRNLAESEKANDKPMDSIEVFAKADEPFFGKAAIGDSKITITGKLKKLDDGRIRVTLRYRYEEPSGQFIPGPNGTKLPITASSVISSDVIVEPGKVTKVGKQETASRTVDGKNVKTKIESALTLSNFDPSTIQ